ncbi:hypothetical protein BDP81DRAFT_347230 [Colletotrichum phormii]|uniref:Uncharacterized protein n=1 Tax=Colletotrichum phormii TaxID=359342 RepID=A0AAI9ZTF6_9PEZI|nr:uncharacterized protein BDP81DRAFT_347230 [Colletotrichum phormii]KAK1637798.1 hypothetical protein BDP81DRAFT_347230 [Colletotrichum phormii]
MAKHNPTTMDDDLITQITSTQPSFTLHSPAMDFIENRMQQYHPAFDARRVQFDPAEGLFRPRFQNSLGAVISQQATSAMLDVTHLPSATQRSVRPMMKSVSDMAFWKAVLPNSMELLRGETSPCVIKHPEWGIRHLTTWPDVEGKLDSARQKYEFHQGHAHVGKFRRNLRSILNNQTSTMHQVVRLVPEIDFSKPIVGAIKVVLDAYRQVSQTREDVATQFEDLPEAFEKIDFYLQAYPKDENILAASNGLVCAILKAIEYSIAFYTSHQAKRAGMALISGPEYQKALYQSLEDVKSRCSSLESQTKMSLAHRVSSDNGQIMQQNDSIMRDTALLQIVLGSIHRDVQMNNAGMAFFANLFNGVLPLLNDLAKERQLRSPLLRTPSPLPQLIEEQQFWLPRDILVRLRITNIDEEDLRHVAESTELVLHEDRGRAQHILGTSQFRNWMASNHSAKLLIHGDFRSSMDISPLSVICTLLTHTFRGYGNGFIGLVFFCGRHMAWNQYRGGLAMVRSLIAQIIRQFHFQHVKPGPGVFLEDIESDDVSILCDIFSFLIRQLPPKMVVFCLVDGICLYETEEYLHGMDAVVLSLVRLVEEGGYGGRPTIKLLITSPQPTVEVRQVFDQDPESLLHMHELPVSGDGMSSASLQEQLAQGFF